MLAGNEYNERGYFEDTEVVRIHEELLNALGRPWRGIGSTLPLPGGWMQRPEAKLARDKLRIHVEAQLRGASWAVKDPRMARLLPLWLELASDLKLRLVPLLCVRSPEAVARSLEHRDGLPLSMGKLLWTIYNSEVTEALRGRPMDCVLVYEDWFVEPAKNLERLSRAVGVEVSQAQSKTLQTEVLAAELQHYKDAISPDGPAGELYAALRSWAHTGKRPEGLEQVLKEIRQAGELFSPWQESRETQLLAEAEAKRAADHHQAVADATRYLAAYQEADQLRSQAVDDATRYLAAYQEADRIRKGTEEALQRVAEERTALLAQAESNLQAYQVTERARVEAVEALYRLEGEQKQLLRQAEDNMLAYREAIQQVERDRDGNVARALEYLEAYQATDRARLQAIEAMHKVEDERNTVLDQARAYLDAYQAADRARLEAVEAMHGVERERDAVSERAGEYLLAYQTSDAERIRAQEERDAALGTARELEQERAVLTARIQDLTKAWQEAERRWKATLCYRVAASPVVVWIRSKTRS